MDSNQHYLPSSRLPRSLALEPNGYNALARPGELSAYDFKPPASPEEHIRYLVLLRRYRVPVTVILVACLLASVVYTVLSSKVYRAQTVLEVMNMNQDFMNNKNVDPTAPTSNTDSYIETQSKLILSNTTLDKTAEALAPKVPRSLLEKKTPIEQILSVFGLAPSPVAPEVLTRRMLAHAKVKPEGQSSLLTVTVDGPTPELAAEGANTLANQYQNLTQEARLSSAAQTGQFLLVQLEGFRKKLQASEDELQNYAAATGLVYTADATHESVDTDKLREIQLDLAKSEADKNVKQARLEMVRSASPEALPEVLDDPGFRETQTKLSDLRRQYAELRATLTPEHYKVLRVQDQIKELETQQATQRQTVLSRIQNEYDAASRTEAIEKAAYARQLGVVSQQNLKEVKYNMLKRTVDANRQIYDSMLQRVNEASVMSALKTLPVRVVDPAKPSRTPHAPSWPIDLGIGFLLGCICSVLYILLRERSDRSVRMPGESLILLDVPELAVIPSAKLDPRSPLPVGKRPGRLAGGSGAERPDLKPTKLLEMPANAAVRWGDLDSLIAESFRSAVTSILLGGRTESGQRVIVVTSAHPQAGKTTAVFSLGLGLAESGRKVLLIDGDLRRPRMGQIFGVQHADGLSNLLTEEEDLDAKLLVKPTGIPGLTVLPSGPMPGNVAQALHSSRLDQMIRRFRTEYDFVLIDTPPMIPLTDARLFGQHSDGVILICRAGQTTMDQLVSTRRQLAHDGIPVMGTILNDWNAYSEDPSYLNAYTEYARASRP